MKKKSLKASVDKSHTPKSLYSPYLIFLLDIDWKKYLQVMR